MSLDLDLAHSSLVKELGPSCQTQPLIALGLYLLNIGLWLEFGFTRNLAFTRSCNCERSWLWWDGTCHLLQAQAWSDDLVLGHEAQTFLLDELMFRLQLSNSFIPLVFALLKSWTFFEVESTLFYIALIMGLFWVVYEEILKVLSYSITRHY